jgi:hypothetical protein
MHTTLSILTLLPVASATIWGTCTPKATRTLDLDRLTYPTTLTEVYSCTKTYSSIAPPFFDRTVFSCHEQTLTTVQPFPSEPTLFPYIHAVTVWGVLTRTEWVGAGSHQSWLSTVADVETMTLEAAKAEATSI